MKKILFILFVLFVSTDSIGQGVAIIGNANGGGIEGKYIVDAPGYGQLTVGRAHYGSQDVQTGCEQAFISLLENEVSTPYWNHYLIPSNWLGTGHVISRIDKIMRAEAFSPYSTPEPPAERLQSNRPSNLTYLVGGTVQIVNSSINSGSEGFGCDNGSLIRARPFLAKIVVNSEQMFVLWFTIIEEVNSTNSNEILMDFSYSPSQTNNFIPVLSAAQNPNWAPGNFVTLINYDNGNIITKHLINGLPNTGPSIGNKMYLTKISLISSVNLSQGKVNTDVLVGGGLWLHADQNLPTYANTNWTRLALGTVSINQLLSTTSSIRLSRYFYFNNPIQTTSSQLNSTGHWLTGIEAFNRPNEANNTFYINAWAWGDYTLPPHNAMQRYPGYSITFNVRFDLVGGNLIPTANFFNVHRRNTQGAPINYSDEEIFSHLLRDDNGRSVSFYSLGSRRRGPETTGGAENYPLHDSYDIFYEESNNLNTVHSRSVNVFDEILNWNPYALSISNSLYSFVIGDVKHYSNYYSTYGIAVNSLNWAIDDLNLNGWCQERVPTISLHHAHPILETYTFQNSSRSPVRYSAYERMPLETYAYWPCFGPSPYQRQSGQNSQSPTSEKFGFEVYPNPANDIVKLKVFGSTEATQITILNSLGAIVHSQNFESISSNEIQLDILNLQSGTYFVKAISGTENQIKRFVVVR